MSYANQLLPWYKKGKKIKASILSRPQSINVDYAIDLVMNHNPSRCMRYWTAKSRQAREETIIPLIGLAFKAMGGKSESEKIRDLLKEKLEQNRPGLK
jgi:Asp-tRNA(Asn)/Glu-tRNA(Gln) amidotransferase B subunit